MLFFYINYVPTLLLYFSPSSLVVFTSCAQCILPYCYHFSCLIEKQIGSLKVFKNSCIQTPEDTEQGARLRYAALPGTTFGSKYRDAAALSIFNRNISSHQFNYRNIQSSMTETNGFKRVTCKRSHPNQYFHELLYFRYREAVRNQNSLVPYLKEALTSLEKYPLPLSSGAECAILKGFDQRLCRYIDLHLNDQPTKKTKVCNRQIPSENQRLSPPVEQISDSEMTTTKIHTANKDLETNTERCSFQSMFGERSYDNAAQNELPYVDLTASDAKSDTFNDVTTIPQSGGNNDKQSYSLDQEPINLTNYFINRSKRDSHNKEDQQYSQDHSSFAYCTNWQSITNTDENFTHSDDEIIYESTTQTKSKEESFLTKINSSGNVGTQQKNQCPHNMETANCKQCSVSSAINIYQSYFQDKTKRDAEEIQKIGKNANKLYKPAYKSGAYAILVALLEQRLECPYRDCLTKEQLIQKAQKHTDQSFTYPQPESNYTAWSCVKKLLYKGMIEIINFLPTNPEFYTLTAAGRVVAMKLVEENTPKITVNDVIFHGQKNDRVPGLEDVALVPCPPTLPLDEELSPVFIEMPPGTFQIILLVDKRENVGQTIAKTNKHCKLEMRNLNIGDFIWVARSKKTGQELVLPYIIERKRMDDLGSSIKDGRYHEQKFRLRKCGFKNVHYLVENHESNEFSLPETVLMRAMVNTSILDEFSIIKTDSWNHTFAFLEKLSEKLVKDFMGLCLRGSNVDTHGMELMTFDYFNKFSCKNKPLTVRDTFIKMLLQLKGLSVEKALAITGVYGTPRLLMKAYEKLNVKEGELLLAKLKFNYFTPTVGPTVSKTVYKLFSKEM